MKKIKLGSAVLFLTTLFIFACSKDESSTGTIENKLTTFENSIDNKILKKNTYTLETIKSPNNEYDFYGEKLLNSIDALFLYIDENSSNSTFDEDFESFIQNEISRVNPSNIEFNIDEQSLFDSFINKVMSSSDPISIAKEYEDFAIENYQDQALVGNFLIVVSEFKYAEFANKRKTLKQVEACADECMEDNYASYGFVRWAAFAVNPGADVLWSYAACIEDCW